LKRHESHALEPRAFLAVFGDPVIVSAAVGGGIVLFGKTAHVKSAGWKEHGSVDSFLVHIAQPGLNVADPHPKRTIHAGIPLVIRQQRPAPVAIGLFQVRPDIGIALLHVSVGIDDSMSVHGFLP
jgi:hypothetical protein